MIRRYTVIGNPIEHSLSPQIHAMFAEQTQREIDYTKTLVREGSLPETIQALINDGISGLNVTVPFKEQIIGLCDHLSPAAALANAANTIKVDSAGKLTGFNTDGSGLLADLSENLNLELSGQRILIAGAGGSVRGILAPLLSASPASITIVNRTIEKAESLAKLFKPHGSVNAISYEALESEHMPFKLIINATSLSLQGEGPPLPDRTVDQNTLAYDLMYGRDTPFLAWAKASGARTQDGLGMLLEQAADAFFIWEDRRPKTRLILPKLVHLTRN